MKVLLALYPRAWRRRYGAEFAVLLDEQPRSPGVLLDVLLGAIDAHLDPQLADDGEPSLRRRMKDVVMNSLRSQRVLTAIGLSLPLVGIGASYFSTEIRHGGLALPMAIALATGLLVGRWWAPLPFIALYVVATLVIIRSSAEATAWFTQVVIAWALVCLIGVGVRVLLSRDLAHVRTDEQLTT